MAPSPVLKWMAWTLLLLGASRGFAQDRCQDVFQPQQSLYSADYITQIQSRLGGHASRWHELFLRIHQSQRPIEELVLIDQIFANTQARSWLARQANSFRFVRLESIARTLDHLYVRQIDLSQKRQWSDLTLDERRALLLLTFKRWWWEVDSHQVLGFSRWTDVSYLLSRSLTEPLAAGRLDTRFHELLGTASQTGFLSSLIGHFRTEIRTLESLRSQPEAQTLLVQTLGQRLDFLQSARRSSERSAQRLTLLNIQILRTAVLRRMLELGRSLQRQEIQTLAREMDLPVSLVRQMYWGQLGMSLIPNMNSFVNMAIDIAVTMAVAYVIAEYWFVDLANDDVYQGSFNDLLGVEPLPAD